MKLGVEYQPFGREVPQILASRRHFRKNLAKILKRSVSEKVFNPIRGQGGHIDLPGVKCKITFCW